MLGWIAKSSRQMWSNRNCFSRIYGICQSIVSKITLIPKDPKLLIQLLLNAENVQKSAVLVSFWGGLWDKKEYTQKGCMSFDVLFDFLQERGVTDECMPPGKVTAFIESV